MFLLLVLNILVFTAIVMIFPYELVYLLSVYFLFLFLFTKQFHTEPICQRVLSKGVLLAQESAQIRRNSQQTQNNKQQLCLNTNIQKILLQFQKTFGFKLQLKETSPIQALLTHSKELVNRIKQQKHAQKMATICNPFFLKLFWISLHIYERQIDRMLALINKISLEQLKNLDQLLPEAKLFARSAKSHELYYSMLLQRINQTGSESARYRMINTLVKEVQLRQLCDKQYWKAKQSFQGQPYQQPQKTETIEVYSNKQFNEHKSQHLHYDAVLICQEPSIVSITQTKEKLDKLLQSSRINQGMKSTTTTVTYTPLLLDRQPIELKSFGFSFSSAPRSFEGQVYQ